MEFNVYIKTFNKIFELDTMPTHTILQLEMYISKRLNIKDFTMVYLDKELKYGTVSKVLLI